MKPSYLIMILAVVVIGIILAQSESAPAISNKEFKQKLKNDKEIIVLDVRTEAELTGPLGHIEGIIHIPVQELEQRADELEKYKENEIMVICRTGNRSGRAVSILVKQGFNAVNVEGGMVEYRKTRE